MFRKLSHMLDCPRNPAAESGLIDNAILASDRASSKSQRPGASGFLNALLADQKGNILPLAAGGIFLVLGMVGGAVDFGRAYKTQNRLQSACDAGVLAGRRAVANNGFDAAAQAQAVRYFNVNFSDTEESTDNTHFLVTSTDGGKSIVATASSSLDTVLLKLFAYNEFDLSITCSASMGAGNSDVMMVLDNTGSMDGTLP